MKYGSDRTGEKYSGVGDYFSVASSALAEMRRQRPRDVFDEDGIMMETTCGLLLLKGAGMHIGKLDLEAGDVVVDGSIDSMTYSDGTLAEKHSILGRLFR